MGSRLVAEYDPATSQYYYYTQDQIGSTRVVTNDAGAVVYAAAHDPYGGIQQTWANAFDPKRKFSDKERDEETGLDYFGARYYASEDFRWLSTDPVLDRSKAIANSQFWNLYAFCANNPVSFADPDGKVLLAARMYDSLIQIAGPAAARLSIKDGMLDVSKLTIEDLKNSEGAYLLWLLATSQQVYAYSESPSIMTAAGERSVDGCENLDNMEDWRYPSGKSPQKLPPPGVDATIVVDPRVSWTDRTTGTLSVSLAAIAFHELAEAFMKIEFAVPYVYPDKSPGAHAFSGWWEQCLINQREGFTGYPAGGSLRRQF